MNTIVVVPLGPGGMETLTLGALDALTGANTLVLRTGAHPVAEELARRGVPFTTLDALYERSEDFDELNRLAADELIKRAAVSEVCYAVPDPLSDGTVGALPKDIVRVLPGVPLDAPVRAQACAQTPCRCVGAGDLAASVLNPREGLTVIEMHTRELAGDVKLKLMTLYPETLPVCLMGAGWLPLCEVDRQDRYDHTTALYVPPVQREERARFDVQDLIDIMRRLRAPDGCPWDRVQTHETLRPSMIEEAYEAVAAINEGDAEHITEELGDVLLQVVFHALVGEQYGTLTMEDITTAICTKMVSRHSHVFGNDHCDTPEAVLVNWEAQKRRERADKEPRVADEMEAVPRSFPMLLRAEKVQKRAHKVGFDFASAQEAFLKVEEELSETREALAAENGNVAEELGDLLFAVCNVTRLFGLNAELLLCEAVDKFQKRFTAMENAIISDGKALKDLTVQGMDVYWNRIKQCV